MTIELQLPPPWPSGTSFRFNELQQITWLVGANGTGKSRFLRELRDHPSLALLKPRLLSTERISAARRDEILRSLWGDNIHGGIQKTQFANYIQANHRDGVIVGAVTLLYQRPDLRIRVEATLSQLLDRQIKLEMTDGNLTPRVRYSSSQEYSMFADECHGVLELLVLLANIYDDETQILLIDEPEQNLHPQYQAFVLDELQRAGKKVVLATHSPSFLNIKTLADLQSIICFHPDFALPSIYQAEAYVDAEVKEVLPRMTEQHRSFFFAKQPVFVEGYFDASVIGSIQRSLGLSSEAAGSCLIPSLGKEEAGRYLMLCNALGKNGVFLFDLDALFDRRLRIGANQNPDLASRIAKEGHGNYDELVGRLQRSLGDALKNIEALHGEAVPAGIQDLHQYLIENTGPDNLEKRRVAMLVALSTRPPDLYTLLGNEVDKILGFLQAVLDYLASVGIHVLPGGALENYLPSYIGSQFKVPDDAKRPTALAEQTWLATNPLSADILKRYGVLAEIIQKLPARPHVDVRPTLRRELANLLHHLIMGVRIGHVKGPDDVAAVLGEDWRRVSNFITVGELDVRSPSDFSGQLVVLDKFGIGEQECRFDSSTQTNNPEAIVFQHRMQREPDL